ncbi:MULTISPECIES: ATP-binding protein [unclassified Pedobacter]|uniref:tetratricopeptide repeat-containing sensor histidine kinase n=1 Tax=unclassified Pedobacter TaxID=2628915 RepID=UPI001DEDFC14|nr:MULTISPECIES: ATP-binding protein [unclassified Pedobacter]CAH0190525.1 Redox sensor histidine kinase response regulator DevS [Pedobacter sp. Bi36]CAH0246354.1 Redox sensor histidine kinase response regulator DevS [Pedobacter sp. Bi126]
MKYYYFTLFSILFFLSCSEQKATKEKKTINPDYDKAFEFREKKVPDSSFIYFNKAKDVFLKQKDSLGVAKCLVNMAITSIDKGDYFGGQEISTEALTYFNKDKKEQFVYLESTFHELGVASSNLKNYSQAIIFYNQSITYAQDSISVLVTKNSIANAYGKIGAYQKALALFSSILKKKMSDENFARTLSNYAFNKWKQNPHYNAKPELLAALHIRLRDHDLWGQNASFAHLADYHTLSQPDTALFYAHKMYEGAKKLKSPDDQLQALLKIIKLSPVKETKQYFNIYKNLDDSLQTARNAAKNQFALIRYETEKSKADFLKAKAENIQKQKDILLRNIGIGTLALCLILGYFLYQRRQKNLRQEKEIEVKKTELKYVKKIHDRVANRVYQVMSEVENTAEIDKNDLADKLDVIYKISRDLSYDSKDINNEESFSIDLSKMLYAYASAETNITLEGGGEKLWEAINDDTKAEVFCILQELMTNMKKHSGADTVTINFKRENDRITILYVDNGKGMEFLTPKNGLRNTETRIESISGHITFDTKPDEGLRVEFSFPTL